MFELVAHVLEAIYAVIPSYGFAIAGFTVAVYLALTPLTIHQVRATQAMQRLQPQAKALRKAHEGDRERLNQEMVALYQREGVNPASGCLPMLVQMPVLLIMFRVIRGLTAADPTGSFEPKYLDHGSRLFSALHASGGPMI